MNPTILNRAGQVPSDGWYQFEVPGEHINHDAKVVQVIDAQAIESILNRFSRDAAQPNFAGILVDKDHFSLDASKPSEAMGWALEIRNRAGTPEARIDWTSVGRPLVEGKTYKFFSTVYAPGDVQVLGNRIVNGKPYRVVRPLHLSRLALTNDPNNPGGRPISNRNGKDAGAAENPTESTMKNVLKLLSLADDASEESAVSAIQTIQNRATQAEGKVTTLTAERDELLTAQVESDLEKYAGVIANRDGVKAQLIANRKGTLAVLAGLKPAGEAEAPATRITNRGSAKTPEQIAADQAAQSDKQRGSWIANRANELRVTNPRLSRSQAFAKAEGEYKPGQ